MDEEIIPRLPVIDEIDFFNMLISIELKLSTSWHNNNIVHNINLKIETMLRWSLIFLVVALVAALFGFTGIAASAAGIAKILFFIFIVLFVIALIIGGSIGKKL